MNYLAHILLSCEEEELLVGNFLGDFINNKQLAALSEGIQKGVKLHRLIDSYTDTHPIVKRGVHRLRKRHGKYAGVVIDVFFDYILAKNWSDYGPKSLQNFANDTYLILQKHTLIMPEKIRGQVNRMIAANWLISYSTFDGIAYTFERLKKRVSKPEYFEEVMVSLKEDELLLTEEFQQFFPDIEQQTAMFCDC